MNQPTFWSYWEVSWKKKSDPSTSKNHYRVVYSSRHLAVSLYEHIRNQQDILDAEIKEVKV